MKRALCPGWHGGFQPGASLLPRGPLAISGDIFVSIVTTEGGGATDISWVEARDGARRAETHGAVPTVDSCRVRVVAAPCAGRRWLSSARSSLAGVPEGTPAVPWKCGSQSTEGASDRMPAEALRNVRLIHGAGCHLQHECSAGHTSRPNLTAHSGLDAGRGKQTPRAGREL